MCWKKIASSVILFTREALKTKWHRVSQKTENLFQNIVFDAAIGKKKSEAHFSLFADDRHTNFGPTKLKRINSIQEGFLLQSKYTHKNQYIIQTENIMKENILFTVEI